MEFKKRMTIILLIFITSMISFYHMYRSQLNDFNNVATAKESLMKEHLLASKTFIDGLRLFGHVYFEGKGQNETELYSLLRYDAVKNSYNLDSIGGTIREKMAGNLTGIGAIPAEGPIKEDLILALQLNTFFSYFYKEFPDTTWLYYMSENNFVNIYPWVSSQKFSYTEKLKTVDFYTIAKPENNPGRKTVWSPAYLDEAGKGFVVTLSAPIYHGNTFQGVVSLDMANNKLSQLIRSEYDSYLVEEEGTVLAVGHTNLSNQATTQFQSLVKLSDLQMKKLKKLENRKVIRLGSSFLYKTEFKEAPWTLYLSVPVGLILGKSILFTLPILLLGLSFYIAMFEIDRRKKTESELANSLVELKSYQELLERAAKYDYLTSTVNRRGLMERYHKGMETENADHLPELKISYIMGDIDCFKQLNDSFGHPAGDKVLIEISELMKRSIGDQDVVCRWGGEEFVIMLWNKTYEEALELAEQIRKGVESMVIPWEKEYELKFTMTFGVQEGGFGSTLKQSISEADCALYIGKENGRNQVVGYRECIASE